MHTEQDADQSPEQPPPEPRDERRPENPRRTGRTKREIGGPEGPEPTRYGDWERNGRCTDF